MSPSNDIDAIYGFTPLPADASALPQPTSPPKAVPISSLSPPSSPLAERVQAYCQAKLSSETFNHSMRVYCYGLAIARECFPDWHIDSGSKLEETWFCTAMLHDIGNAEEFIASTKLSYEFFAGYHALDLLQNPKITGGSARDQNSVATKEQAESVAEAIIRHQDVQDKGSVTLVTQLIQLGTLLDNIGAQKHLVARGTIEGVVGKWPRTGWSGCFKRVVEKEMELKPWAMVSRIEGFDTKIMSNEVMREWD